MRGRRLGATIGLAVIGALCAAGAAAGGSAADPPLGSLVLGEADLPGWAVALEGPVGSKDLGTLAYERVFRRTGNTRPYGPSKLVYVASTVSLSGSDSEAKLALGLAKALYGNAKSKAALEKLLFSSTKAAGQKFRASKVAKLPVGDGGFVISLNERRPGGKHSDAALGVFRLGRAIESIIGVGTGAAAWKSDISALAKLAEPHIRSALQPTVEAAPLIAGTPQQGQTLSASAGTWGNTPTSYGYQWQQCDATGASCTNVADATSSTYVVTPANAGFTLRVEVTAVNDVGSTVADSAPTAVVT